MEDNVARTELDYDFSQLKALNGEELLESVLMPMVAAHQTLDLQETFRGNTSQNVDSH
jgi:hypothetical protein